MRWVRFHKRYGAWPGLAALVLQAVLSFGHIHIGNVHVDGVWRSASAAAATQPVAIAPSSQKSLSHNSGNSGQNSGDNDDYCAVCASIFLASTSLAAQPPLLPVPLDFARVTPTIGVAQSLSVSRPAFFQSRAPPLV